MRNAARKVRQTPTPAANPGRKGQDVGKWLYRWEIEYYTDGGFLHRVYVEAKTRTEALEKAFKCGERIIEIKCCHRTDTY